MNDVLVNLQDSLLTQLLSICQHCLANRYALLFQQSPRKNTAGSHARCTFWCPNKSQTLPAHQTQTAMHNIANYVSRMLMSIH